VKVLAFRSPLWKRGAGGDFIKKIKPLLSMTLFFIKFPSIPLYPPLSPSIPLFQRGKSKAEYFHSLDSVIRQAFEKWWITLSLIHPTKAKRLNLLTLADAPTRFQIE